jgi:hypothetical protein
LSSYLSLGLAAIIAVLPLIIVVFTLWNRTRIEARTLQESYGSFYDGLK